MASTLPPPDAAAQSHSAHLREVIQEQVIAAGGHLLREGQLVAPVDRDNRPVLPSISANATAAK